MTKTAHKPNEYNRKQRSKRKTLTSSNMDAAQNTVSSQQKIKHKAGKAHEVKETLKKIRRRKTT